MSISIISGPIHSLPSFRMYSGLYVLTTSHVISKEISGFPHISTVFFGIIFRPIVSIDIKKEWQAVKQWPAIIFIVVLLTPKERSGSVPATEDWWNTMHMQTVYRCSERRMNSGKEIFIPYRKIALAIYGWVRITVSSLSIRKVGILPIIKYPIIWFPTSSMPVRAIKILTVPFSLAVSMGYASSDRKDWTITVLQTIFIWLSRISGFSINTYNHHRTAFYRIISTAHLPFAYLTAWIPWLLIFWWSTIMKIANHNFPVNTIWKVWRPNGMQHNKSHNQSHIPTSIRAPTNFTYGS